MAQIWQQQPKKKNRSFIEWKHSVICIARLCRTNIDFSHCYSLNCKYVLAQVIGAEFKFIFVYIIAFQLQPIKIVFNTYSGTTGAHLTHVQEWTTPNQTGQTPI